LRTLRLRSERFPAALLFRYSVVVVALALRLPRLGDQNLWWDEGYSVFIARLGLRQGAVETAYDVHPPLYYWLLHFWRLAAGEGEWALRFLSLLLGVLAVSLLYRLAREMGWREAAALAALLLAVSRFGIAWSQETRMYALATCLGLASTLFAQRLWRGGGGLAGYVLSAVALLHTLYLGVLFLVVQNVLWLLYLAGGSGRLWRRWLVAQVAVSLLLLPWLSLFLPRLRNWSVAEPIGLGRFLLYYWGVLTLGTSTHIERQTLALVVLGVAFCLALVALLAARGGVTPPLRGGTWSLMLAAALPPLLVFLLSRPHGFFYSPRPEPRYLNPFAPFAYLLWAAGLVAVWRWRRAAGVGLAALCLLGLVMPLPAYYAERYAADDYRSLASTLDTYRHPADLVLLHTDSDWPVFAYYYRGQWRGVPNDVRWDAESAEGFLGQYLPGQSVAWLVLTADALRADPGMALEVRLSEWCAQSDCRRREWRIGEGRLLRFGRGVPLPPPSLGPARAVTAMPGLAGGWWPYRRARSAGQWQAYVWWRGEGPLPVLSLESRGTPVAMVEPTPEGEGEMRRLSYSLVLPGPGRYALRLMRGGQAVALTTLAVGPLPDRGGAVVGERQALAVGFNEGIHLDGYALSATTLPPGEQLCVVLYWRAEAAVAQPYSVFVHLLGQTYNSDLGNFLWGQHDGPPAGGLRPIPGWQPGETIEDNHCFAVDAAAPPGSYQIEVGLYDPATGERLAVTGGGEGNRVLLGNVEVR